MNAHKDLLVRRHNSGDWSRGPNSGADLETYAELLGGEVDGNSILCPSPGQPDDDRSMSVRIYEHGDFYVYDCDGSLDAAYALVRKRLKLAPRKPSADNSRFARDLLSETVPAPGTLVERYLRKRALTLPIPPSLRYHPRAWHKPSKSCWPAVVSERTDVEGRVVAIHRTFIAHPGFKAPVEPVRMDLGPTDGSAIRLAPVAEELAIGEGIETTLAAMEMYGLPGWAAGSARAMRSLLLPPLVKSVIVLVDNDKSGTNASQDAAQRWLREGRKVRLARSKVGNDFNDWLVAKAGDAS